LWFESPEDHGIDLVYKASTPAVDPPPHLIQWIPVALYLAVKRLGLEADHSPLSSANIKNELSKPKPSKIDGWKRVGHTVKINKDI
jgi:hypothetical protein